VVRLNPANEEAETGSTPLNALSVEKCFAILQIAVCLVTFCKTELTFFSHIRLVPTTTVTPRDVTCMGGFFGHFKFLTQRFPGLFLETSHKHDREQTHTA